VARRDRRILLLGQLERDLRPDRVRLEYQRAVVRWQGPSLRSRAGCLVAAPTGALAAVAASLLLLALGSAPLVAAGIVAAGVAIGFLPSLLVLAMLESPPARSLGGAAGGLYYSMSGFAGLTGPVVIGVFADWTGGFTAGLVAMAALVAAGAAVAAGALPMPPSAAASASEAA